MANLQKVCSLDFSLLHVEASFLTDWFSSGERRETAMQRLQTWAIELGKLPEDAELSVEFGKPAQIILNTAERHHADIILLGSNAVPASTRYRVGKVAERVVHDAKQTVWICKTPVVKKILCGYDGSAESGKALQCAIKLCRCFSAQLSILSVLSHSNVNSLGMEDAQLIAHENAHKTKEVERIQNALSAFDLSGIDYTLRTPWGRPSQLVLDMAEDFQFDLIVVGARGHNPLHHILIGSTAERILKYAPCSLLVVR